MKAIVLGAGMMGGVAAHDLIASPEVESVTLVDIDGGRLERWAHRLGRDLRTVRLDVADETALAAALSGHDVACACLLNEYSVGAVRAAIAARVHMVDLAAAEGPAKLALNDRAAAAGITVVPGCGVAPGLSNVLVGRAFFELDRVDEAVIKVGGLPLEPRPPLNYRIVYALDSVFASCIDPSLVIRDGRPTLVPALADPGPIDFPPPIGRCECFITDGLCTLAHTYRDSGIKRLEEKTIRYPGWVERMGFLAEAGFLSSQPVSVDGATVKPRRLALKVLEPYLGAGDERDLLVMRVEASGVKGGAPTKLNFELIDFYDEEQRVTAMARTTSYTGASVCRMLGRGEVATRGVVPPERLGEEDAPFQRLLSDLRQRGVNVTRVAPAEAKASKDQEFEAALIELYRRWVREVNYRAQRFLAMVRRRGPVEAARAVINASEPPRGFTRLRQAGRLDLTVEALVVENRRFHHLLTPQEVERAKTRLIDAGHQPKTQR